MIKQLENYGEYKVSDVNEVDKKEHVNITSQPNEILPFIVINNSYALDNGLKELEGMSPLYISHLLAYGISSAFQKLQHNKRKLSAIEFYGAVLLEDIKLITSSQRKNAEKGAFDVLKTLKKIKDTSDCISMINMEHMKLLENVLLDFNSENIKRVKEISSELTKLVDAIYTVSMVPATELTTDISWWNYYWVKNLRHTLSENILLSMHSDNRPFSFCIKQNGDNSYIILLDVKTLGDSDSKKHIKNMEKILIESYDRSIRRIKRLKRNLN